VTTTRGDTSRGPVVFERHYAAFAAGVLGLAFFNFAFRLGSEFVHDWDESLYGTSAWEAVRDGSWIGTTFRGELDYYNAKPPLMVWLIALAFKAFGTNLISLRLASAVSAWLTVAVLQRWARRCFGPFVALITSLVLATTFGFVHVHSGRSAATDALFTLFMSLTVVTLWAEEARPWRRVWLGPLLAGTFLLRGMAVLMPVALVATVATATRRPREAFWKPTLAAAAVFLLLVAPWFVARYAVDGLAFFRPMFVQDFLVRSLRPIEEHAGGPLYYLDILQKHHYDWLLAGAVALLLLPLPWRKLRALATNWRDRDGLRVLLAAWAGCTLAIPTVMQTKTPWYLNTFYPMFAVGLALSLAPGLASARVSLPRWRAMTTLGAFLLALVLAEGKLIWYSFHYRDLRLSGQSLLLEERYQLRSRRVYMHPLARADWFVAEAVVGAAPQPALDRIGFFNASRSGDYLLGTETCDDPELKLVRTNGRQYLCRRFDRATVGSRHRR